MTNPQVSTSRAVRTAEAAEDLNNPVVQSLVEEVERLQERVEAMTQAAALCGHGPENMIEECALCQAVRDGR